MSARTTKLTLFNNAGAADGTVLYTVPPGKVTIVKYLTIQIDFLVAGSGVQDLVLVEAVTGHFGLLYRSAPATQQYLDFQSRNCVMDAGDEIQIYGLHGTAGVNNYRVWLSGSELDA